MTTALRPVAGTATTFLPQEKKFFLALGNVRLLPLLRQSAGNRLAARNVLVAWLAGNLFLGRQICWVLRPFIWGGDPVVFFSPEPLHGSFYEAVLLALKRVL